jgi:Type III secretory pathway, lipoprotein EscJ
MKYLILLLFTLQLISCRTQIKTDYKLLENNSHNQRVDSLFKHHINSLKSNIKDGIITEKRVSEDDILFLNFVYYLSGIKIEREHSYGISPLYIESFEIKEIENWYHSKKDKITWDNVNKIYFLMSRMESVKTDNFDELESVYNKIGRELSILRIE